MNIACLSKQFIYFVFFIYLGFTANASEETNVKIRPLSYNITSNNSNNENNIRLSETIYDLSGYKLVDDTSLVRSFIRSDIRSTENELTNNSKILDFFCTAIPFSTHQMTKNAGIYLKNNTNWLNSKNIFSLKIEWMSLSAAHKNTHWFELKRLTIIATRDMCGRENLSSAIRFMKYITDTY